MSETTGEATRGFVGSGRARGIAAAISAAFAFAWFGWGMAAPTPGWLTVLLQIGRGLAVLVAILGIMLAARSPADSTPMSDPAVARRYGSVVGVEFAVLALGGIVLTNTLGAEWVPVWFCAGVGIHFIPLSRVFRERSLMILGALVTIVAAAALVVGVTTDVAPGTIAGSGTGLCLLGSAAVTLVDRRRYTARAA